MKKVIILWVGMCALSTAQGQGSIKIDTVRSLVKWKGSNLFKFNEHEGTVKFSGGNIFITGDSFLGGNFEVDMNTITNTDGGFNEMLVSHLKGEDFFHVKEYPWSHLVITKARALGKGHFAMEAVLTLKEVSRPIKYRAVVEHRDGTVVMRSKLIIDRTQWGINYESRGLGGIKDDIISDAIELEVTVFAK